MRTSLIATLTPNPALDLSGVVKALTPNEKNSVHEERRDPGGNGINAARVAHRLGARVLALGFAGGAVGRELLERIRDEGVRSRFVRIRGDTRINVTVTHESTHQQTRLSFQGPDVQTAEWRELLAQIDLLPRRSLVLLGGSLPRGVPEDFHTRLALRARRRGLGVILDVPPGTLRETLEQGRGRFTPLLVKPNESELARWWYHDKKMDFPSEDAFLEAGRALARSCALVCISRGARGLRLVHGSDHWDFSAPPVKARGTVGAGDSLLGAIAARLAQADLVTQERIAEIFAHSPAGVLPIELHEAMLWGLAAGAATASEIGTALARSSEVKRLLKRAARINPRSVKEPGR